MKNVLLLIHQDAGQEARLGTALDLTRALSGQLQCLDVTPPPLIFDTGWAPPVILDEADRERDNRSLIRERLSGENVDWTWTDVEGDFTVCLLEAARTADLIVLNRQLDATKRPNMSTIASRVLAHSDALVVAVDEKRRSFDTRAPALVAWDGSQKALQALERATPLLALAGGVTVFQAGTLPRDGVPATEAIQHLAGRGIAAQIEIGPETDDPAAAICAAAHRLKAGYCVMGAFGHSRIREALFGGVSRRMLSFATIPLVMAH
jgi:nucleotide-binding universal stress UspA family protein